MQLYQANEETRLKPQNSF